MSTLDEIAVLIERVARILQNETHIEGLKPTQWEALRYLSRANRFSRSPSALTVYLGVTKGTVSQTLIALERKGLITKAINEADKRQVTVSLTRRGIGILENDPVDLMMKSVAKLSTNERDSFAATMVFLLKDILRRLGGRAFGACKTCRFFQIDPESGGPYFCGLLEVSLSSDDSALVCVEHEQAA